MEKKRIEIICKNTNQTKEYFVGTSLQHIITDLGVKLKYPALGARVNNKIEELSYEIFRPKIVDFFDFTNIDGYRMYQRSLSFVLMKAVKDVLPEQQLLIEHSISRGFYCTIAQESFKLTADKVLEIADRMREIIAANIPFIRKEIPTADVISLFEKKGYYEKVKLFKTRPHLYTSVYILDDQEDYFYGYLVPTTGYLVNFDLIPYYNGMLLRFPSNENPDDLGRILEQEKLFEIFREYKQWGSVLGVSTLGSINEQLALNNGGELIKIAEALHEKKVGQIADIIKGNPKIKLILIAGPSSSGKTTFAKRLSVQLKVSGLKPVQISLDNYFVDRDKTPLDENGEYDFESLEALDIESFNMNMLDLLAGKKVQMPQFSFDAGKRFYVDDNYLEITPETIVLVEGIHGLNPKLSEIIPNDAKFKIYVSALTQLGLDSHNRIPTTDNRLLRRIIRDYQYRGYSALQTLRRWPSVRNGENRNIFPFQEEADIMFNSALLFELGILKKYVEPLLKIIPETEPEFSEALRLLKFLEYFMPFPDHEVPPTSILREFLSGSSFKY